MPAGLLLRMSAYVIILCSHPLDTWYVYLYSSFHFRTISLVERALVGGHCVRRLIRGHRVCPAGRLIRSLRDEGRGFDSHIVHTENIFIIFCVFFLTWGWGETSPRSLPEPRSREKRIFLYIRLLDHDTESRVFALEPLPYER